MLPSSRMLPSLDRLGTKAVEEPEEGPSKRAGEKVTSRPVIPSMSTGSP